MKTIIKAIENGEMDGAIIELMRAQYEAHACGRALIVRCEDGKYSYQYDEADCRGGDPEATGEDRIVYAEPATRDYDAMPEFSEYEDDYDGEMTHNGWTVAKSRGETVAEAIKNYIDYDIEDKLETKKQQIIEKLKEEAERA